MVRNAKHKPADMKAMYRHFAAVTIVATALVGVFADGEAQQAVEDKLVEKAEQNRLASADPTRQNRELIRKDPAATGGSFGPSTAPIGIAGGSGGVSSSVDFIKVATAAKGGKTVWEKLGLTREDWFKLPPDVRKSLAGTNDPMIVGTEEERREAVKKLSEASRSRARPDLTVAGNAVVVEDSTDF